MKTKQLIKRIEKDLKLYNKDYKCVANYWRLSNMWLLKAEETETNIAITSGKRETKREEAITVTELLNLLKQFKNKEVTDINVDYKLTNTKWAGSNFYLIFTHKIDLK